MNARSGKIIGTGAVVALSTALPLPVGYAGTGSIQAKFITLKTPSTNSAAVLVGGAEVAAGVGFPTDPGVIEWNTFPINGADDTAYYDLSQQFVYVALNDILYIIYGG